MIFSVMSYERENIIFHEKNLKLTKNNTFKQIFLTIASYQFEKNIYFIKFSCSCKYYLSESHICFS